MNRVYEVDEGRPFVKLRGTMLAVTLLAMVIVAVLAGMLVLSGPVAESVGGLIGLSGVFLTVWNIAKWPVMLALIIVIIAVLYYATPNVKQPKFKWMSMGSGIALVVFLLASLGFGFYVANFGNYNKTYGALGGVIVMLLWLWILNMSLLFGAEFDAEMERGRQLQAGIKAEETIQLPPRDTKKSEKLQAQEEEDIRHGRELREKYSAENGERTATRRRRDRRRGRTRRTEPHRERVRDKVRDRATPGTRKAGRDSRRGPPRTGTLGRTPEWGKISTGPIGFPGRATARGQAGPAVRWPLLRPRPVPPVAVGPLDDSARADPHVTWPMPRRASPHQLDKARPAAIPSCLLLAGQLTAGPLKQTRRNITVQPNERTCLPPILKIFLPKPLSRTRSPAWASAATNSTASTPAGALSTRSSSSRPKSLWASPESEGHRPGQQQPVHDRPVGRRLHSGKRAGPGLSANRKGCHGFPWQPLSLSPQLLRSALCTAAGSRARASR